MSARSIIRVVLVLAGMGLVIHGGQQASLIGLLTAMAGTVVSVIGLSGVGVPGGEAERHA